MNYAPLIIIPFLLVLTSPSHAQSTERVSLSASGEQGNDDSQVRNTSLSANGRYVAFESYADNLVPGDSNAHADIFIRDLVDGSIQRVSVNSNGIEGNAKSESPSMSADGRYVAFHSYSTNLYEADLNYQDDVFVHDRMTGQTECVSRSMEGSTGNGRSWNPVISGNGRFVAFLSRADNLVPLDTNWNGDIFVYDRYEQIMTRVSVSSAGVESNSFSEQPSISASGRMIAFTSHGSNLVADDLNGERDVFVHDLVAATTIRVSVASDGTEANAYSHQPCMAADGNVVVFTSYSDALHELDTNKNADVYLHDLRTSETDWISHGTGMTSTNKSSTQPAVTADGQMVVFQTGASNWLSGDTNGVNDIYLYHRGSGGPERISIGPDDIEPDMACSKPAISADGGEVVYHTRSGSMFEEDSNDKVDVYLRRRPRLADLNRVILTGPLTASTGEQIRVSWAGANPETRYWLLGSRNLNGAVVGGHRLDLGFNLNVMAEGANLTEGRGWAVSNPIPPEVAGWTYYLELICQDGNGGYLDSIAHPLEINL